MATRFSMILSISARECPTFTDMDPAYELLLGDCMPLTADGDMPMAVGVEVARLAALLRAIKAINEKEIPEDLRYMAEHHRLNYDSGGNEYQKLMGELKKDKHMVKTLKNDYMHAVAKESPMLYYRVA